MNYLTKLRAVRGEEIITNKLNKSKLLYALNNSETKKTNLTKKLPAEDMTVEQANKPDGSPLTPVYWERGDGSISGPATVELFYRMGPSDGLIVKFRGDLLWINVCTLRSQRQWAEQKPVIEVDRRLLKA